MNRDAERSRQRRAREGSLSNPMHETKHEKRARERLDVGCSRAVPVRYDQDEEPRGDVRDPWFDKLDAGRE